MIQEYCIQSWSSYIDVVTEISTKEQYHMWYRGQADCSWGLVPSIQRVKERDKLTLHHEQYRTTNFMISVTRLNRSVPRQDDYAGWLAIRENQLCGVFEIGGWNVPEQQMQTMQKMIEILKPGDKRSEVTPKS